MHRPPIWIATKWMNRVFALVEAAAIYWEPVRSAKTVDGLAFSHDLKPQLETQSCETGELQVDAKRKPLRKLCKMWKTLKAASGQALHDRAMGNLPARKVQLELLLSTQKRTSIA